MRGINVIKQVLSRLLRINRPSKGVDEGIAEGLSEGMRRKMTWIDGEDSGETEKPMPMFYVGDTVVLYNPYEGAFMTMDFLSLDPERYRVVDVAYDEEEKVFRYKLEDGGEDDVGDELWYSEDWLSLPTVTKFTRVIAEETNTITKINPGGITMEAINTEGAILAKAMADTLDDDLRKREIDRFLDLLRTGNAEERKAAEKELRKITTEGSR